ncbi:hypothetical protein PN36_28070 [Candidatus Thiomargarita nelsonii]|uniref:Calcineurin-like phosphoesterase domain-containing protein n=1 Tax=Candidatus Thiomargarita nelsonii TaxID=1003181 RepID=A0A0A6P676_9GAMM|nr:hypothetical protein PN36_28070 [Candidatus Thiomargarita nelsonii]
MKKIFIISDLHLGGRPDERNDSGQITKPGFQICHAYPQLTAFIDWINKQAKDFNGDTEIVINGDIVDFLADDDFDDSTASIWTANETEAISKLNQIIKRTREGQNRGPFDALKNFIAQGNQLTLILGNHDIELALPQVPPAGTLLVIYLINRLKKHYRFVDLLKPETGAVIPLLVALKADYRGILQDILSLSPVLAMQTRRGRLEEPAKPAHRGNLKASRRSSQQPDTLTTVSEVLHEVLGKEAALFQTHPKQQRGDLSARRQSPSLDTLLEKAQQIANTLLIAKEPIEQNRLKRLHVALKQLNTDNSFDISQENANYLEAAKEIIDTGKFSHVVFGHTHLPKQIDLQTTSGKNGQYLNTGTWADVIRLPAQIMQDNEAATKALTDFIEAMRHNELSHYIKRYLSYVEVTLNDNKVTDATKLQAFCGTSAERERALTTFPM